MASFEEKVRTAVGVVNRGPTLLEEMKILKEFHQDQSDVKKNLNSELWHACAGPLITLPQFGSLVYYFPQGHSEQVAMSTKCMAASHIPNYPNLPSQLMCQVHNVTLHAEKDTDEIYAQMTLQPVNSENDLLSIPVCGKPSKHPSEFFCKTLTASDTSTHGGFSVPRRAAEKLFPSLDYSMQPPTQELVVRDLHDYTWAFRHIYRGQPKRHLLTTGWSAFVTAKRLRAGDAVLFIRDEKSQLLLGVRRANHQQTVLPSSVLSADSMHIGVLAAAAHATANRSTFSIFYNPRACPSEFVIPFARYQKVVYGTQASIGMRFGMMFETEESGKRRYMGSIIGISDIDPLRWPSSKWRNLQVEWDEAGSVEKPNRICLWDIDTPDNLYQFSSLASSLKRPMHPIVAGAEIKWGNVVKRPFLSIPEIETHDLSYNPFPSLASKHLAQNLLRPPSSCLLGAFSCSPQSSIVQGSTPQAAQKCIESLSHQKPHILPSQNLLANYVNPPRNCTNPLLNLDTYITSQIPISEKCQALCTNKIQLSDTEKQKKIHMGNSLIHQNPINQHLFLEKEPTIHVQTNPNFVRHQINSPQLERSTLNGLFPFPSQFLTQYQLAEDWNLQSATFQPLNEFISPEQNPSTIFPDIVNQIAPSLGQEIWGLQSNHDLRYASQAEELSLCPQQEPTSDPGVPKLCEVKETLEESKDRSEIYNNLHFDPSISSDLLDTFGSLGDICFQNPSDCLVCSLSSSQGIQSKITTTSFPDTQDFSLQEFPNTSGGTSSSNVDFDETSLYQNGSWQQLSPHLRTYTKVQKLGSVGRSIDVSSFKNYDELRFAIACMFSLEGLLDDPKGSGWELVYVDYENDVLLVGDDPWEEFVSCVRCIRVVSPSEIQKLGEDNGNLNTVING